MFSCIITEEKEKCRQIRKMKADFKIPECTDGKHAYMNT